jgi:hypothetical protein
MLAREALAHDISLLKMPRQSMMTRMPQSYNVNVNRASGGTVNVFVCVP